MTTEPERPVTVAERLDNARTGQEWGSVLGELFTAPSDSSNLTIKEMAAALGRTVQAVRTKRRLIDVDPRMSALCGFTALERDRDADE